MAMNPQLNDEPSPRLSWSKRDLVRLDGMHQADRIETKTHCQTSSTYEVADFKLISN